MKNIFVFLSVVILIDCAVLPRNQIENTDALDTIVSSTEPFQDYTNIETTQIQETSNIRNGDQLKRCSDYDIVSSSYQPDAVLALSRREINLLERNRERCELCRNNPICKKDITRCRTCKRICDSVAEQTATTTTESTENNIPEDLSEPILGQQQLDANEITMRFGDEASTNYQQRYFSLGSVQTGPTMDLIAKLFNVDNKDGLEQFIILGKLKQDDDHRDMVRSTQPLFIWDLGQVFGWRRNKSIPIEIHSISDDNRIDDNNKKIDLAEELNKELDKAIRNKKSELGQSRLSRNEIDNLINATMTKIMQRHPNDTVGCSLEEEAEEFEPIIDLRNRPEKLHKTSISNPSVIQNSFDPKLGAKPHQTNGQDQSDKHEAIITQPVDTITDDKIVGETLLTSTDAPQLPESDNQIADMRDNDDDDDSSEESRSFSGSLESTEDSYVGANQAGSLKGASNLPNLIQNAAVPENLQQDITKIVEDSFKIPNSFRQTGENSLNSKPPKNLQTEVQNVIEDGLKVAEPTANIVGQQSPHLSTASNQMEENGKTSNNLQEEVQKVIEDSLKMSEPTGEIVAKQSPNLPANPIMENTAVKPQESLQEEVQKIVEDSLTVNEPTGKIAPQQIPDLSNNQIVGNTAVKPQKSLQEEVQEVVEDSLKVHEPTDGNIVGQQTPNLPTRNKIDEPHPIENPSVQQTAPSQIANLPKTVTTAPYEGMPAEKMPKVFPYDLARPIPNTPEYDRLRQFEGMPAERISKVFPDHLARQFTQLPEESTNDDASPTIDDVTTPINIMENDVGGSPLLENRGELSNIGGRKFHSFGSLIPAAGQNADNTNVRNVYFLGKDIALPLRVYQDPDGVMQLSVDMEKLCNCKNKTCMKTHKNLEEFGNNLLKKIETEQNQEHFEKTSDIMKRSPKIDNYPINDKQLEQSGNYLDFEDKLNKLHQVVENFEKENENLLEESTKILLKNVENEGKAQKSVDLINKMLKWMKNVVTEKQK